MPPDSLREPKDDMTLCIAALARDEDNSFCLVTCSDKMESTDVWGSETLHKVQVLSPDVVSLFADSPARAKELKLLYEEYLGKHELQAANVVQQLEQPLIALKRRLAASYVGRRLGLSYEELVQDPAKWQDYLERIEAHQTRVSLIVAGFIKKRPILLQTAQLDTTDPNQRLEWVQHFAVIGSGSWLAEPSLRMREQDQNTKLGNTLYNVYEAKRQAEIGPAVGKKITRIYILRHRRAEDAHLRAEILTQHGLMQLQELYEMYGPKKTPAMYTQNIMTPKCLAPVQFSDPEEQ